MTYFDLEEVFLKWLHFDTEPDELLVSTSTVLANRLDSQPVWLFLVGPASSTKSTIMKSMEGAKEIYMLSTLTQHALLSGYKDPRKGKQGKDYSIMQHLHDKTLVIKDFTSVISMRPDTRENIFGQLRDAYDGFASRATGTGVIAHRAKFGILAACTAAIEDQRQAENFLGERFLYYKNRQSDNVAVYRQVMNNLGKDSSMSGELREAMNSYLNGMTIPCEILIPSEIQETIARWSMRTVILRTSINRDRMSRQIVTPVVQTEFGSRFATQIATLYHTISLITNHERAMKVIKRIIIDAIPSTRVKIIRGILSNKHGRNILADYVKVSPTTVQRTLEELRYLDIINRSERLNPRFEEFFAEVVR